MVGAFEPVAGVIALEPDRLVVVAVARVLAPAVVAADAPHRQKRARPRRAVGAPPHPAQPERAARRAAIAFALVGPDAAAPERDRERERSGQQPAAAALAWPGLDPQAMERNFFIGSKALLFYPRMLYFAQSRRAMAI